MDFELTDEQQLIRETAREFTDREIVPRAAENARNHHFDLELVAKIAEQGYLGAIVPREYGGAGLDYVTYGLLTEEIGRGDSAMRTVISVQTSLVCSSILRWGTEEQKGRYLPRLCSGEWLGCFGLTEPDTGSDAANQRTRAMRQDDGCGSSTARRCGSRWATTRRSRWSSPRPIRSRATAASPASSSTPTSPASSPPRSTGRWACTAPTPRRSRSTTSSRPDAMLGEVGDGFKVAMTALDSGRYSVAAGCVGLCQACVDESVAYAKEREQFGRPIASFQLVQAMLADMKVRTDAARMLVWRAGALKDAGQAEHDRDVDRQALRDRGRRAGARTARSRSTAARATSTTTRSSATSATCA